MSISPIANNSNNPMASSVPPSKGESSKSSDPSSNGTTVNYSSASISDLETLASQGDVRAQNELALRKAAEDSQNQSSSSSDNSGLNIIV